MDTRTANGISQQIDPIELGGLQAYFDCSQVPGYGAIAVAGYLSSAGRWERFGENWRDVLQEYDVSRLHMAEFESGYGEFQDWLPTQKKIFMRRLIGVLRQTALLGVSVGLLKPDFESIVSRDQRKKVPAYGLCSAHGIGAMMRWVRASGGNKPIAFVFEKGDLGAGLIDKGIEKARHESTEFNKFILSLDFKPKGEAWGLEAADFLAYEAAKNLPRRAGLDKSLERRSWLRMVRRVPYIEIYLDAEFLRKEFPLPVNADKSVSSPAVARHDSFSREDLAPK